jgi:5-methylcytosine-specific restriction endonuclease McrA
VPIRGAVGERNTRSIPQDVKIAVSRDQGRCVQCGSADDLHYDHKIPWSKGGTNTVNNIQLLCGTCNRLKGADDIPVSWEGRDGQERKTCR